MDKVFSKTKDQTVDSRRINSGQSLRVVRILRKGISIYLKNFLPFSRTMLFPVFGQVLSVILILTPVYFYRQYFLSSPSHENPLFILAGLILIVIPGFNLLLKSFWDYMIAMVSLNTMTADIIGKNSFGDFKKHNNAVKLRVKDYAALLFIVMGIGFVLSLIPFVALIFSFVFLNKTFSIILFALSFIICMAALGVISVYLCLSFQVFAFESLTPVEIVKKSFFMMKNRFWQGIWLACLLFIFTGIIIPSIIQSLIGNSPFINYLVIPFDSYLNILSDNSIIAGIIQKAGSFIPNISREIALSSVGMIVTSFILPLGSACYTLLYFDIKKKS